MEWTGITSAVWSIKTTAIPAPTAGMITVRNNWFEYENVWGTEWNEFKCTAKQFSYQICSTEHFIEGFAGLSLLDIFSEEEKKKKTQSSAVLRSLNTVECHAKKKKTFIKLNPAGHSLRQWETLNCVAKFYAKTKCTEPPNTNIILWFSQCITITSPCVL